MISCGKERAACRNIMIKNGVEIDGSASAIQVLTSFHADSKAEMPTKNWQELKSHKKKLFLL